MDTSKLAALSLFFSTIFFSLTPAAAQSQTENDFKHNELKYQQDNVTNQIPYFDNRFRIDAELEEIKAAFAEEQDRLDRIALANATEEF